jgi:hypothetical protein
MDDDRAVTPNFILELTDRFEEGLALNVADGATDFNNRNMVRIGDIAVDARFDLVCDVGNDLDGAAVIPAGTLPIDDGQINSACGNIGILIERLVDEALIMTEVKIGFGTIIRNKNFAMLNGVHGTRVDVEIWIELLHGHGISTRLEKTTDR